MSAVFSALANVVWMGLPSLLGILESVLPFWETRRYVTVGQADSWNSICTRWFHGQCISQRVSPICPRFNRADSYNWTVSDIFKLTAWFFGWAVHRGWIGLTVWAKASFENLREGIFFPVRWNFHVAFLALVNAVVVTALIRHRTAYRLSWVATYGSTVLFGRFFWRSVVQRRVRRQAGPPQLVRERQHAME